jgi:hypothetical protein
LNDALNFQTLPPRIMSNLVKLFCLGTLALLMSVAKGFQLTDPVKKFLDFSTNPLAFDELINSAPAMSYRPQQHRGDLRPQADNLRGRRGVATEYVVFKQFSDAFCTQLVASHSIPIDTDLQVAPQGMATTSISASTTALASSSDGNGWFKGLTATTQGGCNSNMRHHNGNHPNAKKTTAYFPADCTMQSDGLYGTMTLVSKSNDRQANAAPAAGGITIQ